MRANQRTDHYILCFDKKTGVNKMSGSEAKIQVFPTFATKLLAVQKRSGETVPFDARKIFDAIKKAVATTEEISDEDIVKITQNEKRVYNARACLKNALE